MECMRRGIWFLVISHLAMALVLLLARAAVAPLLHPALGFAAKVSCSGVLVGGATLDQVRAGFPDRTLRRVVRVHVDPEGGYAEARVPLLAQRRAVHRPGLGCTLVPVGATVAAAPAAAPVADRTPLAAAWPAGGVVVAGPSAFDDALLSGALEGAFAEEAAGPAARTLAVVVVHGGRIAAERYAPGYSVHSRFPGWSMAKSVTGALAGIVAGDGLLRLDATALRPEWQAPDDPRRGITLNQLMQMTGGLDFDESYTPRGGATRMLFNSPDVAADAAGAALRHEPGTRWYYASGSTNIISAHLRELLGDDAYARLPLRLFEPLGMHSAVLEPDATGTFVGSSFMYATARDWARFGLLFLQDGVWEGERILPEGWVEYSVTPAAAAPRGRYGAQWWLNAGEAGAPERRAYPELPPDLYWASGFQGQYVAVIPSRELVVVRLGLAEGEEGWDLGPFLRRLLDALAGES
jgi:CubicO group peptidase (beta-lactamase class C family)